MAISITIPKLGVEMTSAKLVEWREENGAKIEKGQIVAVIETDKLTNELESTGAGYLVHVGELDKEYDIGVEIAKLMDTAEEALSAAAGEAAGGAPAAAPAEPASNASQTSEAGSAGPAAEDAAWVRATPLARAIARARGIDLHKVTGTGYSGTVTKKDVESYVEPEPAQETAAAASDGGPALTVPAAPVPQALPGKAIREERPFSPARAALARHMMQSLATMAQMTDMRHLEVSNFMEYRNQLVAKAEVMGFKVTYLDLMIKATANILKKLPEFNASVGDNTLIMWDNINIGIGVANDQGLIVPVLHDVDKMSLAEIHEKSQELFVKAREHRLQAPDISGGTFTISSYGNFGSEGGTPVINMPQVAILGVGAMLEAPVVKNGALAVGHVMCTSLTLDHRVLDGESAAAFQNLLKRYMENPELILID